MKFDNNRNLRDLARFNAKASAVLRMAFSDMREALQEKLSPTIRVYPIDTGLGKSTLIKSFLAEWKAEGFKPEGSILIALNTKAEIEEFAAGCGLDEADYSAYTSDEAVNAIGAGANRIDHVPVLFTTQSMLRRRLYKKPFENAQEFYYKGKQRSLRIWDEHAVRAEPIHITVDDIARLYSPVRSYFPEWVEGIEAFVRYAKTVAVDTVVTVPTFFGNGAQFKRRDGIAPILSPDAIEIYKALKVAMGKRVRVCGGKRYGTTLVGAGNPLPADLAPLFVFDASARIGDTYELWDKKNAVAIMPAITRNYCNLTVYIWKTACGRTALESPAKRDKVLKGLAKALDAEPMPTLLIAKKATSLFDLHSQLLDYVATPDDVSFAHWGRHYGTNAYRCIKRVVVIGAHQARDTADLALYAAASGVDPASLDDDKGRMVARARMQQNLLQAFSRGNLRNGIDGQCGECAVYFIAPPSVGPEQLVRDTFPGCKIEAWQPFNPELTGQAKAVFDVLNDWVERDGKLNPYPKMMVRTAVGIDSASRFGQVLASPDLRTALSNIGVSVENKGFRRASLSTPVVNIADVRAKWVRLRSELAKAA